MHKRIISLTGCNNHNSEKVSVYFPNNIVKNFSYITGAAKYLVDNGYTKTQNVEYVRSAISTAISKNKSYLDCYFYLK